jgi:hypothetical protein
VSGRCGPPCLSTPPFRVVVIIRTFSLLIILQWNSQKKSIQKLNIFELLRVPGKAGIDLNHYLRFAETNLKTGFVSSLFFVFESSIRAYMRFLNEKKYNKLMGIDAIIEYFMTNLLAKHSLATKDITFAIFDTAIPSLQLLKWIRNSLHNNGVHNPENPIHDEIVINYSGNEYHFLKNNMVDFVTWDLLLKIANDIQLLLFHIAVDPSIISIQK